ncbi:MULTISPECIES: hypothetical protein [unclassified Streptomyces]|uniref:hypothetical protein n=1 Tax=unclassified Streptomyces TaxID=2593676 RepID=UPI0035DD6E8A
MTRLLRGTVRRVPESAGGAPRDASPDPEETTTGPAGDTDGKVRDPGATSAGTTPETTAPADGPAGEVPDAEGSGTDAPADGPAGEAPDAEGSGTDAPDDGDSGPGTGTGTATGRFTPRLRRIALVTTVVALLLGGSAFFYGAHQLRSTPSARNHALTDTAATTRVGGDVGEGLARVFSYAPAQPDAAERSAGTVLGGRAARQYADLFAQVRAGLVEQRITLTTQAVRTGVIELKGNTARLLVFLDQTSRRGEAPATSAAAQLTVTAEFRDGRWLIVDIKAR